MSTRSLHGELTSNIPSQAQLPAIVAVRKVTRKRPAWSHSLGRWPIPAIGGAAENSLMGATILAGPPRSDVPQRRQRVISGADVRTQRPAHGKPDARYECCWIGISGGRP